MDNRGVYRCQDCGKDVSNMNRALHEGRCGQQNGNGFNSASGSKNIWSGDYNQMRESPFTSSSGQKSQNSQNRASQGSAFENYQNSQNSYLMKSQTRGRDQIPINTPNHQSRNTNPFQDDSDEENSLDENSHVSNQIQNYTNTYNNYPQLNQENARIRLTTSSSQRHQERRESIALAQQSQDDKFICYKCTGAFNQREFANHELHCEYSNCEYCNEFFPDMIMEAHVEVCEKNQIGSDFEEDHEQYSDYEISDYSEYDEPVEESRSPHQHQRFFRPGPQSEEFGNNPFLRVSPNQQPQARVIISQNNSINRDEHNRRDFPRSSDLFSGGTVNRRIVVNGRVVEDTRMGINNMFPMLNDGLGIFNLFGASPFDPLASSRMQSESRQRPETPVRARNRDPFEEMISSFVNTVRMNRSRRNEVDFITALMEIIRINGGERTRGVNPDNLSRIQTKQFTKNSQVQEGEEEMCPVCQCEFENGQNVKVLPCKHMYHPECIDPWLANNTKCPSCRQDVEQGLAQARQ